MLSNKYLLSKLNWGVSSLGGEARISSKYEMDYHGCNKAFLNIICKKVKSSMARSRSQCIIYYHRMWGQLSTTCSNLPKKPNVILLVAVDNNQLRTMASETFDQLTGHWHPPPSLAVLPERLRA